MKTSTKFVITVILLAVALIFLEFSVIFGYVERSTISFYIQTVYLIIFVLGSLCLAWILRGGKGGRLVRLYEYWTHPWLNCFIAIFGIVFIIVGVWLSIEMWWGSVALVLLGVFAIWVAYNDWKEGKKRGLW